LTLRSAGRAAFFSVALASFAPVACSSGADSPLSHVFVAPAWTADEHTTYDLVEQGGQVYGTCELQTRLDFEPGKSQLSFLCGDSAGNRDDRTVVTDAATLEPSSATRVIVNAGDNRRTTFTSAYGDNVVTLTADVDGKRRSAIRDLPRPTAVSPNPGYYDDESLLWLVRGIPLSNGYRGAYKDVNAGTGRVFSVDVSVEGQDAVHVPAGAFTAWKVRVHTSSVTHYFWVDIAPPHRVVRARVEHLSYELSTIDR